MERSINDRLPSLQDLPDEIRKAFLAKIAPEEEEENVDHEVWLDIVEERPGFCIPPTWVTGLRPGRSEAEEHAASYTVDIHLSWTPGRGAMLHGISVKSIRNRELPKNVLRHQESLLLKALGVAAYSNLPHRETEFTQEQRVAVIETSRRQLGRSDWGGGRDQAYADRLRELHRAGQRGIHRILSDEFGISQARSQSLASELRRSLGKDRVPELQRGRPAGQRKER